MKKTNLARRATTLCALTAAGTLALSGLAIADDVANNIDTTVDAVAETMSLNVGGANGSTTLYLVNQNGDGKQGCNIQQSDDQALTVAITSSNTAVATVSPGSATFDSCGDVQTLTVTPKTVGSATVSVAQTSNTTSGSYNFAPATFTVNVAPPANTAPGISVAGVTGSTNYSKGSVPAASCQVTDAEDGNSSFPASLSVISGAHSSDGIGSQTASCFYTDRGGLTASASETYNIVDPSAPDITYNLTPLDGNNGWHKSNATLTWNVSEPQSPNSLQRTGCADQSVTVDQGETTYTCAASSAGGSSGPVSVTIKRDGTAPTISGSNVNNQAWRNTSLTEEFTASDALSGLANSSDAAFSLTASQDSTIVGGEVVPTSVSRTVQDNAGNETTRTLSALIDTTNPVISGSNVNDQVWRNTSLTQEFTASDALSGLTDSTDSSFDLTAAQESTIVDGEIVPTTVSKTVQDNAGNQATRTLSALIDSTKPSVELSGGPTNGASLYFGDAVSTPTCAASDALSGLESCTISGGGSTIGTHTFTATATDNAGNVETATLSYTINAWTMKGFTSPVDMGGVVNTVKGGSTVPLKFEMFKGSTELTSPSDVKSFAQTKVTCGTNAVVDEIEIVSTGATSLRYDTTAGQFIQNWKTPTGAGTCYKATMTAQDGSTISALFKIK